MEDKPKIIVMGTGSGPSAEVERLIAALERDVEIVTRPETVFPVIEREIPEELIKSGFLLFLNTIH